MSWLLPLFTLSAMEIILGIDNIVFLTILVSKLPVSQQKPARQLGLLLALGSRIGLLFTLNWILHLTTPLFHLSDLGIPLSLFATDHVKLEEIDAISVRDLILLAGGLFLIGKSTWEIHDKLEAAEGEPLVSGAKQFGLILVQIMIIDLVFSLDSVITAVGMAKEVWIMVVAMIIAVVVMLVFANAIGRFVQKHPTIKMLALSFLILIGVMLVAEGMGHPIERGYIYFAMGFSLVVEMLNLKLRKAAPPVQLHEPKVVPE